MVLTMRAASLRNFSGSCISSLSSSSPWEMSDKLTKPPGHAAFPGGKADNLEESPCKPSPHPPPPTHTFFPQQLTS